MKVKWVIFDEKKKQIIEKLTFDSYVMAMKYAQENIVDWSIVEITVD